MGEPEMVELEMGEPESEDELEVEEQTCNKSNFFGCH